MPCAAILLAAGESKRLGQPKQLLKYQGETLVRREVSRARDAGVEQVVVVTGALHVRIAEELAFANCQIVLNENWQLGLGASLACGARYLVNLHPNVDSVLVLLCDQPFVPVSHLRELVSKADAKSTICATEYPDQSRGVPACFPNRFLAQLAAHHGESGARTLIAREDTKLFACPEAAWDIDVAADLTRL